MPDSVIVYIEFNNNNKITFNKTIICVAVFTLSSHHLSWLCVPALFWSLLWWLYTSCPDSISSFLLHMWCTWCSSARLSFRRPCVMYLSPARHFFVSSCLCDAPFIFIPPWCCPSVALNPDLPIVSRKSSRSSHTKTWQSLKETCHRVQKGKTTVHSIYVKVYIHSR